MEPIKEALTFDDVLLLPQFSSIVPANTNINVDLSDTINLKLPFISSAMDTVTESKMAIAMAKSGGIGIIHRNLEIKKQCAEIQKVKKFRLKVGAAIGTSQTELLRAKHLIDAGTDMIVIDTAHGHSNNVLKTLSKIKKFSKRITICVGNIATGDAAKLLYNSGADILKVGIGPGSICTTRMVAGIGVPQITALLNVKKTMQKKTTKAWPEEAGRKCGFRKLPKPASGATQKQSTFRAAAPRICPNMPAVHPARPPARPPPRDSPAMCHLVP